MKTNYNSTFTRFCICSISIILMCSSVGCVTTKVTHAYDGDPQPESEIALLTTQKDKSNYLLGTKEAIWIVGVTGKDTHHDWKGGKPLVALLPGNYNIKLNYHFSNRSGGLVGAVVSEAINPKYTKTFNLDVEAGHTYMANFESKASSMFTARQASSREVTYWIINQNTGLTIAGEPPKEK